MVLKVLQSQKCSTEVLKIASLVCNGKHFQTPMQIWTPLLLIAPITFQVFLSRTYTKTNTYPCTNNTTLLNLLFTIICLSYMLGQYADLQISRVCVVDNERDLKILLQSVAEKRQASDEVYFLSDLSFWKSLCQNVYRIYVCEKWMLFTLRVVGQS